MHKVQVAPMKAAKGDVATKTEDNLNESKAMGVDLIKRSSFSRILKNEEAVPLAVVFFTLTKLHNKMKLAWKLVLFMAYFALFLAIISLQRDISKGHDVEDAIQQKVVGAMTSGLEPNFAFEDIGTIDDWFSWVELALIPTLFTPTWYNGENRSDDMLHTIGYSSHFIGGLRLLQTRSLNYSGGYCYETPLENLVDGCLSEESGNEASFGDSSLHPEVLTHPAFQYSTDNLGASGFQFLLSFDKSGIAEEVERVDTLKRLRWVDEYTRELVIDGTIYNPHTKLFVAVRLEAIVDLAGGIDTSSTVTVLKLDYYDFDQATNILRCAMEAIWVVFVLYQVVIEVAEYSCLMKCSMRSYLLGRGGSGNLLDMISIVNSFVIMGMWIKFQTHPNRLHLLNKAKNNSGFETFPDLLPLAEWEIEYMAFVSINVMLASLRAVQYFAITMKGRQLVSALSAALPEIVAFLPIFTTVMLGFAFCGHLLFGQSHVEWSTLVNAIFVVVEINFGLYDVHSLFVEEDNLISSLYILLTLLGMCVVFINVFLAIVMAAWDAMTECDVESRINESFNIPDLPFMSFVKLLFTPRSYLQLTNLMRKLKLFDGTSSPPVQLWTKVSHVLDDRDIYRERFAKVSFTAESFAKFAADEVGKPVRTHNSLKGFAVTNATSLAQKEMKISQRFVEQATKFVWRPVGEEPRPEETALQLAVEALQSKEREGKQPDTLTN